jgi:hypothetical protein
MGLTFWILLSYIEVSLLRVQLKFEQGDNFLHRMNSYVGRLKAYSTAGFHMSLYLDGQDQLEVTETSDIHALLLFGNQGLLLRQLLQTTRPRMLRVVRSRESVHFKALRA